ncbi:hypothetical protein BMS3Abin03_01139 [bacterium BMS3Abin03]|nr:hypothetical protein BMS3Abin03_01139 [bacterium BMS3Abin03]
MVEWLHFRRRQESADRIFLLVVIPGLTGNLTMKDGYFIDNETRSKWNITGKAVEVANRGKQLEGIKARDYFAFLWFTFIPGTEVCSVK